MVKTVFQYQPSSLFARAASLNLFNLNKKTNQKNSKLLGAIFRIFKNRQSLLALAQLALVVKTIEMKSQKLTQPML